jgi:two-component system, NarL family, nitrate/nitrite response regulator NarL
MSTCPVRVALVEDHLLLAESLHMALSTAGFETATVPADLTGAQTSGLLERVLEVDPRVVLLDLDLGSAGDAVPLIRPLTGAHADVVVVTGSTDHRRWGECLAHGACAVLPKAAPLETIIDTVHRVVSGSPAMSEAERCRLIHGWYTWRSEDNSLRTRLDRLSPREGQVLATLATGRRVRDIALEAYVSEATVRSQVKSILAKLGVTSQIAAVAIVRDLGWAPPS